MAIDWISIRAEYIAGNDSIKQLAKKHKVGESALEGRAQRGKWSASRKRVSEQVLAVSETQIIESKSEQLAKFNSDDLKVARNLRALVQRQIQMSNGDMDPNMIRSLAGAAAEAQRIGRLALGAETESSVLMTKALPSSIDEFIIPGG